MQNVADILDRSGLKKTKVRVDVLSLFLDRNYALSHHELEAGMGEASDRVTLYRTLKTFLENGILHKVPDDVGVAKYALCPDACPDHEHAHDHVHFKCDRCGITRCLDVNFRAPVLPQGYIPGEYLFLYQGVCAKCAAS